MIAKCILYCMYVGGKLRLRSHLEMLLSCRGDAIHSESLAAATCVIGQRPKIIQWLASHSHLHKS